MLRIPPSVEPSGAGTAGLALGVVALPPPTSVTPPPGFALLGEMTVGPPPPPGWNPPPGWKVCCAAGCIPREGGGTAPGTGAPGAGVVETFATGKLTFVSTPELR